MSVTSICDLRRNLGPARDQGRRPTCCAFASSDLHAACRAAWTPLSCEYAFYQGVKRQGTGPNTGIYLDTMLAAIEQDGQPLESAWPYLASVPPDITQWKPPADVGQLYHGVGHRTYGDPSEVHIALNENRPAVLVMTLSNAFFGGYDLDGVIDSDEPLDPSRVHAVLAVGYGRRGADDVTLIRNSWGPRWGIAGHAWLSHRYLSPRLLEIATMRKAS